MAFAPGPKHDIRKARMGAQTIQNTEWFMSPGADPSDTGVAAPPHRDRKKTWLRAGVALVLIIGLALLLAFHLRRPPHQKASTADSAIPVETGVASKGDFPVVLSAVGLVQALNTVQVHTRIDGTVDKIFYKEGQTVSEGALLAQLDARPYQAVLAQAQAKSRQDEATLQNQVLDLERFQKLGRQAFATDQQIKTQQALVAASKAQIAADAAAVQSAQVQLSYTEIRAPIAGRTGFQQLDAGNIVHASDPAPLLSIVQTDPVTVVFSLPENELFSVVSAMKNGQLKAVAFTSDAMTQLASGVLDVINNQVDIASGAVQAKASFPNPDDRLWPGQSVTVRLHVRDIAGATLVPQLAVQRNQSGAYVWLVGPDQKVSIRPVTTGDESASQAVILSGLAPGDRVVQYGQYRLTTGATVRAVASRYTTETGK